LIKSLSSNKDASTFLKKFKELYGFELNYENFN